MISLLNEERHWTVLRDGNKIALELADRHYSRKTIGAKWFVGVGEKLVLIYTDNERKRALFSWRKSDDLLRMDNQTGVECTLFRNETRTRSSLLIKEAVQIAKEYWPREIRFFTYINPAKIKNTERPGFCFLAARWNYAGRNKNGKLIIMEVMKQ